VIVVIGNPRGTSGPEGIAAAGPAVAIARAAAAAGGVVQLVGKVGDGRDGDAILLSVAEAGVGHIAVLRDASPVTLEASTAAPDDESGGDGVAASVVGPDGADGAAGTEVATASPAPALDAGDLSLALRYLPDYRVVVIATPLDRAAEAAAVEAARWAGAAIIVVSGRGTEPPSDLPEDATVLEAPPIDEDAAFAAMVGRYAAALDAGRVPAEAFADATAGAGVLRTKRQG
jgi:hypothetical protein